MPFVTPAFFPLLITQVNGATFRPHLTLDTQKRSWGERTEPELPMKPLYAARLEDIGPRDLVIVECACGHSQTLTASMLTTAGVKPYQVLVDLSAKLRCRECDERGKVMITVTWAQ